MFWRKQETEVERLQKCVDCYKKYADELSSEYNYWLSKAEAVREAIEKSDGIERQVLEKRLERTIETLAKKDAQHENMQERIRETQALLDEQRKVEEKC